MMERFKFLATWDPSPNFQQAMDDGRFKYDDVILPPTMVLAKHLDSLIRGRHFYERMEHKAWVELTTDMPGELKIEGRLSTYGGHRIEWWISGRVAGDMDAFEASLEDGSTYFHSGAWMHPDLAMAHTIAHIEQYEKEIREGLLTYAGGLA